VGHADVVAWSPHEITIVVHDAAAGALLVLDQNWAPGWTANGADAVDRGDLVAAPLHGGEERMTFRYRPTTLPVSLLLFAIGVLVVPWYGAQRWRKPRSA
jgi:hypothetical protein